MTSTLQEAGALLPKMSALDKAQLLQWVISDLTNVFPSIEKTPGVCGGDACIAKTRIPVWSLVNSRRLGMDEAEILYNFPTLNREDLKMPGIITELMSRKLRSKSVKIKHFRNGQNLF